MLALTLASIPLAIHIFGWKMLIVYAVVIVAIVAVAMYMRRGQVGR